MVITERNDDVFDLRYNHTYRVSICIAQKEKLVKNVGATTTF